MNSKDILIAYINTLSDRECKSIFLLLKEMEGAKGKYEMYNSEGVKDDNGLIKLTPRQYHALAQSWSEEKLKYCFDVLSKYLASGKKVRASHYTLLNGWVETSYINSHKKRGRKPLTVRFEDIKSKAQAILYVANVPASMRGDDVYVNYLVNRWGVDILNGQ